MNRPRYPTLPEPTEDGFGNAVIYTRVSTESQKLEGVSLDAQLAKARAWALANTYEIVGEFSDEGISGSKQLNRPGLRAALDLACTKRAALVVYSLSRLARSTKDAISISERLDKAGADLVSLSEHIDTSSAAGKMVFRMLAVLSEFERDLISERTSAALQYKISKHERTGRDTPYGWRIGPDGVHLEPDERERAIAARAAELHSEGLSLRKVAAQLEAEGMLSRSGRRLHPPATHTAIRAARLNGAA